MTRFDARRQADGLETTNRARGRFRRVAGLLLTVGLLSFHGAAVAEDDFVTEDRAGAASTPPAGMLGPEGVVPKDGGAADDDVAGGAGPSLEPIGHIPGPDEGVYGDPPNTGGTENPETRAWAYDDGYFFAMTRGLESDTDLDDTGRRWVRPFTFTFDVLTLPTSALAGLTGKAPAPDEEAAKGDATDAGAPGSADDSDASTSAAADGSSG